jgi:muramoyltetrapeptide carboxypeptidase
MATDLKGRKPVSVAIVAPASRLTNETADRVTALAAAHFGPAIGLRFHPQCFLSSGHFAGEDAARSAAFLDVANDPSVDVVWFARGGYGSCRLDEDVFTRMNTAARRKTYIGYSDIGFILARLHREGIGRAIHGPMPSDINRTGGETAVLRVLSWLCDGDETHVERTAAASARPVFAFNLTVLSNLLGTPSEPDFSGAVLMLEDVDEHYYQIDRALYHVTSNENIRRAAGLMCGRFSKIPANDPPFDKSVSEIFEYWCARSGLENLGDADVGHDSDNKIVPFGVLRTA